MFNIIEDFPKFKMFLDLRCIEIRDQEDNLICAKLKCPRVRPLLSTLQYQNQIYLIVMGGKSFNTAFEKTVELFPIISSSVPKEGPQSRKIEIHLPELGFGTHSLKIDLVKMQDPRKFQILHTFKQKHGFDYSQQ